MEINVKEIFERANIKQIRAFLLDGGGKIDDNCYGTYKERIERDSEDIVYTLKRLSKDHENGNEKFEEAMNDLSQALQTCRDIYSEMGMLIGAKLLFQLLCESE